MKLICNRGAFVDAITLAGQAVSPRSPKPVLQCVKLSAVDGQLTILATDLELAVRLTDTQVTIDTPGQTVVPADRLRDIVRESIDDTLSLELVGTELVIKGHDSLFRIFTQEVGQFPPVPDFEGDPHLVVAAGVFRQLINRTLFATSRQGSRYAFNGVLLAIKQKRLQLVASDGHRLALAKGDLISAERLPEGGLTIVPARSLSFIEKLLTHPDQPVDIQITENQIVLRVGSAVVTSNLLEGQFPAYEDVVPKDCDKKMTVATADLLSAVRRAALLTGEDSRGVKMQFSKSGLVLSSRSPDHGEAIVKLPCKFEGSDITIGFNAGFIIDALKVVDRDEVDFEMLLATRPGLLSAGNDFLYVLMPVNLSN